MESINPWLWRASGRESPFSPEERCASCIAAILAGMGATPTPSLQERYAPAGRCFGCGPANERGLRIRSFPAADGLEVVADWTPEPWHEAFDGVLNGGIIGTLLDCHANWTATHHLMGKRGADRPPTTVTQEYAVQFRRPTPSGGPVHLVGRVVESSDDRATVEARLEAGGQVTATCRATFVAVKPGHPAYERW
jgi:acyl-coenzyme A thioesterase PaaI-like protein